MNGRTHILWPVPSCTSGTQKVDGDAVALLDADIEEVVDGLGVSLDVSDGSGVLELVGVYEIELL